jgi:methyl coenzyme M reductase subunit C-like uncharacterized protein (methanogenesis marker protein 7)
MSWKIQNQSKVLYNAFKRLKKNIYPNEIESLKGVLNQVNEGNKQMSIDNILFLKLLSIHLLQNLDYYGNIKGAVKECGKLLNQPLNHHIEKLRISLNYLEVKEYVDNLRMDEYNDPEILDKLNKEWSYKVVENSLYNSCNDFIKDVDNYK